MKFTEQLNAYKNIIGFSIADLAVASGLSESTISRYLNGKRTPSADNNHIEQLSHGLAHLAKEKGMSDDAFSKATILKTFRSILRPISGKQLSEKINTLINLYGINTTDLAKSMKYDTSYISKIRNGSRTPADIPAFINHFCDYVTHYFCQEKHLQLAASLLNCEPTELTNPANYKVLLLSWFSDTVHNENDDSFSHFLKTMDKFDLNEYIKLIHFDELKVPTAPFHLHTAKDYYGLQELRQGELDFLKATVLSPSAEPVYLYGDMPMEDMAEEKDFMKKYMFGLAMVLKKGLHIHIVHNLNRPFRELMMGLEGWLPLYMTGQVHPYYFKNKPSEVFSHLNYFSGCAALDGQCIVGHHADGKYHLARSKKELTFYRKKTEHLMTKANSLMDIYVKENAKEYHALQICNAKETGTRHNLLSSPPVFTISEELLTSIFEHNNVNEEDQKKIRNYIKNAKENATQILSHNDMIDEMELLSKEEYEEYPVCLFLSDMFYGQDLFYTYDEYKAHISLSEKFAKTTDHYTYRLIDCHAFRNIQLSTIEGKLAIISKHKSPTIHFVVHHPILRDAIEHLDVSLMEH